MSDILPISETFVSIQGEGKLTGTPSWFCRLAGCNLRCTWCDTPYASWNPEKTDRTIDSLVEEAVASGVKHAVLTGGEPMIFKGLVPLSNELAKRGLHITIETAGTVTLPGVSCHLLSLSPKLANSTPVGDPRDPDGVWATRHEQRRLSFEALNTLIASTPDRQMKFVVAGPDDLPEIESVLDQISGYAPHDVMLMPEGVTVPDNASIQWIIDECVRRGWSYCPRVHIQLFGDTRGT
ncbi:MAG: 7-carboxy-7-deazaguanine synthase QueE [Phycisphaerales bacterium]|nr:7-carboxy-7-deazaguanine synthase QueE [Phycisphaerales bacterium]